MTLNKLYVFLKKNNMEQFKKGDHVKFTHDGDTLDGLIVEVRDNKKAIVTTDDEYNYSVDISELQFFKTTNKDLSGQEPMAKNKKENPIKKMEVVSTPSTISNQDVKKKIVALTCKKHQRIYLLHSIGVDKKEISQLAGANAGEIYNALKSYNENPAKAETAKSLLQ